MLKFLKEIGWEKFTEEMYQEYLKAMQPEGRELVYETN